MSSDVSPVRDFWQTEACGTHFVEDADTNSPEFFERYREYRYQIEWHIPEVVPFESGNGKSVLEIGCGNGVDGVMWARAGAHYTGVDLTKTAVEATKVHFECLDLDGTFQTENAQSLTFEDESFDIVYSHGVLHHTPEPSKAFSEVRRVLKPGGKAILMLYHRNSFNYWVRIMGYMWFRVLVKIMSRLGRWGSDTKALNEKGVVGVRGNEDPAVWQLHYENFLRHGWAYLKPENFVHRCTDGPECPYAFVYSRSELRDVFPGFKVEGSAVTHFPLNRYPFLRSFPRSFERFLARTIGWYLFIFLEKTDASKGDN